MGRRTAEETERLRQEIISAAMVRFTEDGRTTSMAEIAKDVGISKQALMHHFRSREALDEAIAERFRQRLESMLPKLVAAVTAQDAELDAILVELMSSMDENIHLTRFALRWIAFEPAFAAPPAGLAMAQLMLEYMRRGQRDGTLRPDVDPPSTLFNLGLMFLVSVAASNHRTPFDGDTPLQELRLRRGRELVRIARHALLPDP